MGGAAQLSQHAWVVGERVIPELWGAAMVADYLGVKRQNLHRVKGLPEPLPRPPAPTIGHDIWLADDIVEFQKEYVTRRQARSSAKSASVD